MDQSTEFAKQSEAEFNLVRTTSSVCQGDNVNLLHLKKNRSTLLKCMMFDSRWIASEMNAIGLLSDCNYTDISNVKLLGDYDKANMILTSLENKVDINPKHLKTFVELLKKSPKVHSDAIEILQASTSSNDPVAISSPITSGAPQTSAEINILQSTASSSADDLLTGTTCPVTSGNTPMITSEGTPLQYIETPPLKRIKLDDHSLNGSTTSEDFEVHLEGDQKIRSYQQELAEPGLNGENYILVAPTGTGKTLVAAVIIADHLNKNKDDPNSHVVFVVPTKTLADQQKDVLEKYIPRASTAVCTGETQLSIAQTCILNHISVCTGGKLYTEICRGELKFSQLSLIIFDECHSAVRGAVYANIMKQYVEEMMVGNSTRKSLQIIGMTASPGAGKNPHVEVRKTLDHLKMLAAHLNATGGIKTVVKHVEELEHHRNAPNLNRIVLMPRDPTNDPFIDEIVGCMKEIEKDLKEFKCGVKRWSLEYERKIRQNIFPLELSDNEGFRDPIRAFNELLGYCTALSVYMNLRAADAIQVLKEFMDVLENVIIVTPAEKKYKAIRDKLIERLEPLDLTENPLLGKLENILYENFKEKEDSRGLVFVRTRLEARAMSKWISNCSRLTDVGIRPGMLTGHASKKKDSMTQDEQKIVVENFRDGNINLLLATSVAEEGIDIPACNLVMRYQYVLSDIKKEQAEGRARAAESECYTIVSASSSQKYNDMRNQELVLLVRNILKANHFPSGNALLAEIKALQNKIIAEKRKKESIQKQRRVYKGSEVQLICKICKKPACLGSDVRITGENEPYFHYVVQDPEFNDKYAIKHHHTPGPLTDRIYKTHKIYCKECGTDWGVKCVWSDGRQYPIIKCQYFTFKIGENFLKVKKWSLAPFEIEPMDENIDY